MIDGSGIYGFYLHYAFLFAMTLSTLLVLVVLWYKKRLHFEEEPKHYLFNDEESSDDRGRSL